MASRRVPGLASLRGGVPLRSGRPGRSGMSSVLRPPPRHRPLFRHWVMQAVASVEMGATRKGKAVKQSTIRRARTMELGKRAPHHRRCLSSKQRGAGAVQGSIRSQRRAPLHRRTTPILRLQTKLGPPPQQIALLSLSHWHLGRRRAHSTRLRLPLLKMQSEVALL